MRTSAISLEPYDLEHRIFLVKNFYQELGSYACVEYNYDDHFKSSSKRYPCFSKDILIELIKMFEQTGSVYPRSRDIRKFRNSKDPGNCHFSSESPFKCELCEKCFLNFPNLKRHVLQSHDLNDIYKCDFCSMDFRKKYKFLQHMRNHAEETSSGQPRKILSMFKQCDDCGKFCSLSNFDEHKKSHTDESPLKCNICGQEFTWRNGFKLHMMSHRGITINNLSCKICGRKMAGEKTLKLHMKSHGNQEVKAQRESLVKIETENMDLENIPDNPPNKEDPPMDTLTDPEPIPEVSDNEDLPASDDQFFTEFDISKPKSDMRRIYMINPADEIGLCEECGKILSSKNSLTNHMKTHTTALPYKCTIDGCYRQYRWPQSLEFHVITAHDKNRGRNIKCRLCDKGFVYPHNLRSHMRVDHTDDIFSCNSCNEVFLDKDQLDAHEKDWHDIANEGHEGESQRKPVMTFGRRKAQSNPVSCVICDKTFPYKYMLKKHMASHAKAEEDLVCPKPGCGKTFHIDKNLKMHIATHQDRRYKCADCESSYKEYKTLKHHIKRYHLKVDPPHKCKICPYSSWYSASLAGHMRRHAKFGQI